MAIGVTEFINRFPAFRETSRELIDAKLAEAAAMLSEPVWGDKYDLGLGYRAAMLLAELPGGEHARLIPANAKATRQDALTTYERRFNELRLMVTSGFRVTGTNASTDS